MSDLIVVGAGLCGLICAARMAREGFAVRVLERASRVGGRALSPPVAGVPLNLGAHALYLGGPAERALRELGVEFLGTKPSASDAWLADESGVFASPTSVLGLMGARRFAIGERFGLLRFFATLDAIRPDSLGRVSTTTWLDGLGHGRRARRFLDAMVRVCTYSNAPDVLPASIAVRQLQIAIGLRAKGVVYVEGGWQALASRLERLAKDSGVEVTTGVHVTRVTGDGRVALEGGNALRAAHTIVALPRSAASRVVPELGATRRAPVHAACLDLAIDSPTSRRLVFGLDEPHYFSVHSPRTAHAFRYLAPGERGADHERALEAWLDRAVPDWRAHVVGQRFLPEMEVASVLGGEPAPTLERVSFAGDWTSERYVLLDAVAESADAACARVREQRALAAA